MKKVSINIDELNGFNIKPYAGHKNHAPKHPDITAFVQLMLTKGVCKEELLVRWGECMGIKLEALKQGIPQTFDISNFEDQFKETDDVTRAVCYLFRRLTSADMELYYFAWLDTVREATVPQKK